MTIDETISAAVDVGIRAAIPAIVAAIRLDAAKADEDVVPVRRISASEAALMYGYPGTKQGRSAFRAKIYNKAVPVRRDQRGSVYFIKSEVEEHIHTGKMPESWMSVA
jgi:hypothetical protein